MASWFETREDALLTMRVRDLILRSIAIAMRLEGWSHRKVLEQHRHQDQVLVRAIDLNRIRCTPSVAKPIFRYSAIALALSCRTVSSTR
ncbi:MAG: hypothetical protein JWQ89_4265 [Devosia sp.]|nr:hypothetical protein [Devosia sp.]